MRDCRLTHPDAIPEALSDLRRTFIAFISLAPMASTAAARRRARPLGARSGAAGRRDTVGQGEQGMSVVKSLRAPLAAGLFALALAAPAAWAQTQSQPTFDIIVEENVMIPMRDGTLLAADIYRPDAEGAFPTLVERTPYNKSISSEIRAEAHVFFAERGYAFIVQDGRGRYRSEGEFYPFLDDGWLEHRDGFDTVQWIATQPWSDGQVGVIGGSHTGMTAYQIGPTQPPAMKAMFVRESASDLYSHWVYRGGAFEHGFITAWTAGSFAPEAIQRHLDGDARTNAERMLQVYRENMANYYLSLPLTRNPLFGSLPGLEFYQDWVTNQADGPYWWQQAIREQHHMFQIPVWHLGGWYDIFLAGTIENYEGIGARGGTEAARTGQRMVIGPWIHGPTNVGVTNVGEMVFPGGDEVQYNDIRLRFFDYYLKGIDNGLAEEPPVLIYVMGDNVWRHENEWPLERTLYTNFYLRGGSSGSIESVNDGTLSRAAPSGGEHPDSFLYDPADPVPTMGGNTLFIVSGPRDHRAADARSLTYTSEPLTEDLEVTGPVKAVLYGISSAVDTDWTVRLSEVYPDGRSIVIVDGIQRARYAASATEAALIEPGKVYRYEIDLWATSNVFKAGNRLRVSVHSSNFPRWSRNLNTADAPEDGARGEVAYNTVLHDRLHPSHVVLPVIPR
jgi:uncharacterized protein